jgi:serine protease DegQ
MEMVRRTRQQGVPVIAVGDEYIVGFDRPRLEQAIARLGGSRRAGDGPRPRFGASVADATKHGGGTGAYVGRVTPESAAARLGLAARDTLTAINGRPVRTAADVEAVIGDLTSGAALTVTYRRGDEERTARGRL